MNIDDMEIVLSIMKNAGYSDVVDPPEGVEIIFINTWAITANVQQKVWQRLDNFWFLKRLSTRFPEMRFKYTSPHSKDIPEELIYLMRDKHNICKDIPLPSQMGSSTVLKEMRRGYPRGYTWILSTRYGQSFQKWNWW
ncbi:hypothetical protein MLD38_029596 [Melastoma candidum]|uniref:Uncharacterized protein n=1 Tax=Melastoma candidum TaxID=119954 RepID=A0ACB9N609_9MYRT|nr:hypothetical protein MLD38_029596 [Melastoma candidum]